MWVKVTARFSTCWDVLVIQSPKSKINRINGLLFDSDIQGNTTMLAILEPMW